ncbi:MAG: tRNA (adenosine(37)-N6)-threonylcarbamoyltransferase complex dimerization subunit type 1 TsaB [Oligoflexia bacterium]|nr:tRNA (adenosine(37)-N6)-threonylcarbamoyltransferase complex dimerization subunit type 1 TsaB [Oligoflexia bacterium]
MSYRLSLSTSTDRGSVALFKGDTLLHEKFWARDHQSSELVTQHIQLLLKKFKLHPPDIESIVVDRGPGSFTGSRVGVTVAKTLAYAIKAELYSVTSLDLISEGYFSQKRPPSGRLIAILDAHKSLYYFSVAEGAKGKWICIESSQVAAQKKISDFIEDQVTAIAGLTDPDQRREFERKNSLFIKRKDLHFPSAKYAWPLVRAGRCEKTSWSDLEPLYIRDPDVLTKFSNLA